MNDTKQLFFSFDDLHSAIRFDKESGTIWLEQQRMLLLHASTFGVMRSELFQTLGKQRASGILMRMGYKSGRIDAELAKRLRPNVSVIEGFSAGPQLHSIEGIVRVIPLALDIDEDKNHFYGEFIWENSFEADEHLRLFGISEESVCWHLVGYACGFTSKFMGFPVYYKEVECTGKGDKHCKIVGKPLEEWEDAKELEKLLSPDPVAERLLRLQDEVQELRSVVTGIHHPEDIVADSPAIQESMKLLSKAAATDVTVLMLGETGVGKEVFCNTLHKMGSRKNGPFITINCAALPRDLIESELFGVEKGAFTGADKSRPGRFEMADGGTLFLDELGELSEAAQAKLLRVLQTGEVERLGSGERKKIDVRLVAATNADLDAMVKEKRFRADLFYRLNVFPITIPPLRERLADLPGLTKKFIKRYNAKYGKQVLSVTDEVMVRFRAYSWPGNIRELENILERGVILADNHGYIESTHICIGMPEVSAKFMTVDEKGGLQPIEMSAPDDVLDSLLQQMECGNLSYGDLEADLLKTAYERSGKNVSAAARLLGMSGPQYRYRLKKLGIS